MLSVLPCKMCSWEATLPADSSSDEIGVAAATDARHGWQNDGAGLLTSEVTIDPPSLAEAFGRGATSPRPLVRPQGDLPASNGASPSAVAAPLEPADLLPVHRQELRELLDDWAQVFLQAMEAAHVKEGRLPRKSPLVGPSGSFLSLGTQSTNSRALPFPPPQSVASSGSSQTRARSVHTPAPSVLSLAPTIDEQLGDPGPARKMSITKLFSNRSYAPSWETENPCGHNESAQSPADKHAHFVESGGDEEPQAATAWVTESGKSSMPTLKLNYSTNMHNASWNSAAQSATTGSQLPGKNERMRQMVLGTEGLRHAGVPSFSELPVWRQHLINVVGGQLFESFCASAILANAFLLGWMADYQIRENQKPEGAQYAEMGFTLFFAAEVALKLLAFGRFFFQVHLGWNLFDSSLVVHGIVEVITSWGATQNQNQSFLRVLRLAKMLRILRILRFLQGLRALRLIINSIMGSASAMLWSVLLLAFIIWLFAVVFVQAIAHYLHSSSPPGAAEAAMVRRYWGSLSLSMLSLFQASTGGEDWAYVSAPLMHVGLVWYFVFIGYIAFFLLVVMNAITSLFVEATRTRAARDDIMAINLELEEKDKYIEQLQDFFRELLPDEDGRISAEEFANAMWDPRLQVFAASLGIDVYDALAFFKTLSGNLHRTIDLDTFVVGCIKLRGEAKAVDMYALFAEQKEMTTKVTKRIAGLEFRIQELRKELLAPRCSRGPDEQQRGGQCLQL